MKILTAAALGMTLLSSPTYACNKAKADRLYYGVATGSLAGEKGPHKCNLSFKHIEHGLHLQEGYCISPRGYQFTLTGVIGLKGCKVKPRFGYYLYEPLNGHAKGKGFRKRRLDFKVDDVKFRLWRSKK